MVSLHGWKSDQIGAQVLDAVIRCRLAGNICREAVSGSECGRRILTDGDIEGAIVTSDLVGVPTSNCHSTFHRISRCPICNASSLINHKVIPQVILQSGDILFGHFADRLNYGIRESGLRAPIFFKVRI